MEDKDCPLGCSRNDEFIIKGRDRICDLPGEFHVVRCRTCDLMRTNPRPTVETIDFYYPDQYGPFQGTKISEVHSSAISSPIKKLIKKVFRFNVMILPGMAPGRLLEVGCASGSFMHQMALLNLA